MFVHFYVEVFGRHESEQRDETMLTNNNMIRIRTTLTLYYVGC